MVAKKRTDKLPRNLKGSLPAIEQIEAELELAHVPGDAPASPFAKKPGRQARKGVPRGR